MSAVWSWRRQGEFHTYDPDTSARIEAAFQQQQKEVRIRIGFSVYVVDFLNMRQVSAQDEKKWRVVRRSKIEE